MLWQILVAFLFRLSGGLATAMAVTSSDLVTPGFFRVHLWVALGLNSFAAVLAYLLPELPQRGLVGGLAVAAAIASYVGAVMWLYEVKRPGRLLLIVVAVLNVFGGAYLAMAGSETSGDWLAAVDTLTAALLLGFTFTAMLLGHWYLNTPSMKLQPLQRLVLLMVCATLIRGLVAVGSTPPLAGMLDAGRSTMLAFVALRWLAGLIGILGLAGMTWQTLKIPNTQSATGILYVAVIFAFLGELSSQLLLIEAPNAV
ncbi:MAG: hypothetical protein KDB23_15290 [Planctomycetales bacterium]|nr:hypothetical protein [Planctomycetales bacterium]